jgi:hypothetical protein
VSEERKKQVEHVITTCAGVYKEEKTEEANHRARKE